MKFLCLHGTNTNAEVLEMQLAPITFELSQEKHTFTYLNGQIISDKPFPGLEDVPGPFYRYYDRKQLDYSTVPDEITNPPPEVKTPEDRWRQLRKVGGDHERKVSGREFVEGFMESSEQGPFDGIIGFSEGALVAADVILHQQSTQPAKSLKCAIFFCGAPPWDYEKNTSILADETEDRIRIPTVSVLGKMDPIHYAGVALYNLCEAKRASLIEHEAGHTVPRDLKNKEAMLQAVRRAVNRARMMK